MAESTTQLDAIDKEIETWLAENETAAEVMGSLVTLVTEQAEKYHIPHPIVYVHLAVLSILMRSQMEIVAKDDPVQQAQLGKLDEFIGRMTGNGKAYQEDALRKIKELEGAVNRPPAKTQATDGATGLYQ
jgi:hypothetical protein